MRPILIQDGVNNLPRQTTARPYEPNSAETLKNHRHPADTSTMNTDTTILHTAADLAYFAAVDIDPHTTQPRETRPTPCRTCATPTMNQLAGCDRHYITRHNKPWPTTVC